MLKLFLGVMDVSWAFMFFRKTHKIFTSNVQLLRKEPNAVDVTPAQLQVRNLYEDVDAFLVLDKLRVFEFPKPKI